MKRYMLFSGSGYYPRGGINDFQGSFDSADDAVVACNPISDDDWAHVYDTQVDTVVRVNFGRGWKKPKPGDMLQ